MSARPKPYRHVAAAAALLTFSSLASAQSSTYDQELATWPGGTFEVPGEFESVTAGDVNGDLRQDLVVNCLQGVVVMFSVATVTAPFTLMEAAPNPLDPDVPHMANEVAVHPDTGEIFTIGYNGLTSWVWNSTTNDFDDTLIVAGAWVNGTDLRFVAGLHGDGSNALIALDSTGANILLRHEYVPGIWSLEPSIATVISDGGATDLTEVQWRGNTTTNPLELCYASSVGMRVLDLATGASIYHRGTTLASHVARAQTNGTLDRIEWLAGPTGNGKSYLSSVGPAGILGTIEFVDAAAAHLAVEDLNGDGIGDSVVTFSNKNDVMLVEGGLTEGISTTQDWINGDPIVFEGQSMINPGPGHNTEVAIHDLDGDGVLDMALMSELQLGALLTFGLETPTWSSSTPLLGGPQPGFPMVSPTFCRNDPLENGGVLTLDFDFPLTSTHNATRFDVSIHRQTRWTPTMQAQALETCIVYVNTTSDSYTAEVNIPDSQHSPNPTVDDHFFILIEPMDTNDVVAGRTLVYEYSYTGQNTISLDHASNSWTAVLSVDTSSICQSTQGPIGTTGGGLSKKRPAPVPPNTPIVKGTCP